MEQTPFSRNDAWMFEVWITGYLYICGYPGSTEAQVSSLTVTIGCLEYYRHSNQTWIGDTTLRL